MAAIYHVTSHKKLSKYVASNEIHAPVRAWLNIGAAERFSKQTGRQIILRLKKNPSFMPYAGHRGEAVISHENYSLRSL